MSDPSLQRIRRMAMSRLARRSGAAPNGSVDVQIGRARIVPTTEADRQADFREQAARRGRAERFRQESAAALEDTRRDAADTAAFQQRTAEQYRRAMHR